MRKPLASRILGLVAIYSIVFCFIVILQFSNKGNFSLNVGSINIKGRYLHEVNNQEAEIIPITGGVRLFYGGLEFNLKEERGKGLTLTSAENVISVNPEFMTVTDTSTRFIFPNGTSITFSSFDSERGHELQINAEFSDNTSEIIIPVIPRRSSLVRDNGQVGILFSGNRYFFTNYSIEIEEEKIILSKDISFVSYRARSKQTVFDPSNFILEQSQDYAAVVRNWQNASFTYWNQNASTLQSEDDVIAYLSEALGRGNFPAMLNTIPSSFYNSSRHSHRSAVFLGGMTNAYRSFINNENDKSNMITRLIRERSLAILKEEKIIAYLITRGNNTQAYEIIELISSAEPAMLNIDYCAGLLEIFSDVRSLNLNTSNSDPNYPIGHLKEQILNLISGNLHHDSEDDIVYISASEGISKEYNLRLGKALDYWAQNSSFEQAKEWSAIGKSLVLSAIKNDNSGNLYNHLNLGNYYPRATVLLPETGHWAWTVSPSVRASYIDGNLNLAFNFPVNASHYTIIRGIRPFLKVQIYGMDWRTDSQFERYDSSGWVYYPQEQALVLKVRHRATTENVRIFYRVDAPPPVIPSEPVQQTTEGEAVE